MARPGATAEERELFDACFDSVVSSLPEHVRNVIDSDIAVIVDDGPDDEVLREFGLDQSDPASALELLGLHTGTPLTERSVEDGGLPPPMIHLYRLGLLEVSRRDGQISQEILRSEIRTTLLHEIGHHFGLEEDDLDSLGYG